MSADSRQTEFDAITSKDIFEEAKDRLNICLEAESSIRPREKDDAQFRRGKQWKDSFTTTLQEDPIELTINLTDALVRRVENNMREQRPRGKCHPVGDGADIDKAKVINGYGRHVETRSEASVAYDMAADQAVTSGRGYFRLLSEYVAPDSFDQDLRIVPIADSSTVFMDPSAIMPSGCDQWWNLISVKMRRTEYKRLNPRSPFADFNSQDKAHRNWDDKEHIRLAEYLRIREIGTKLFMIRKPDGTTYNRFKDEMPATALLAEMRHVVVNERESARRQVEWFKLNGLGVLPGESGRRVLPGDFIPVFRVLGNQYRIDGELDFWGMVDPMKDAQSMVNFGEVAKIKRLGLTPQSPWIGAEGQFDGHEEWDNTNTQPYAKLVYKPVVIETANGPVMVPPPQRQPPAQIEAGFSEFTNQMRSNLLAIADMQNDPGQDMQGEVVSGEAQRRRDARTDKSHLQYYGHQTLAIAQCWRVMLQWIPYYVSEERLQRIIGDDNQPQMITVNQKVIENGVESVKNDLSVGRYDVVMDTGPGYDTKREEGADTLINLLKIPLLAQEVVKVGSDLVFRSLDHPYMQELADRIAAQTPDGLKKLMAELPERARAIIQALWTANQGLQQKLQQTEQDLKAGITKAHIGAVVKAHDTEESNETKRLDTETRARTARDVEEIRAASDILIEKLRHGHDERMAEHEAKQLAAKGSNGNAG